VRGLALPQDPIETCGIRNGRSDQRKGVNSRQLMKGLLFALLTAIAVAGCDSGANRADQPRSGRADPDVSWMKDNLLRGIAEPRLRNGLLPSGFYQPNLGPDWTPVPPQTATLISQTRFVYVMAMAYEVGGDDRFLDAMKRAADFLLARFVDARTPGRWARAVSPDGKVVSDEFHAYGHAHVVFALTHAYKVTRDTRYLDAAMHTWLALDVPSAIAGKHALYALRGLNTSMHTFEALLVLYKATRSKLVGNDLKLLGEHLVSRFFDPQTGLFVESLTTEMTRKPDGEVRLGHSIETAFLLSRAVDAGLPDSWLKPANASVSAVARIAARDSRGLIPHAVDYAGNVREGEHPWWSQTELLRGLAHFVMHRGRSDLRAQFERSLKSVRADYIDPVTGGWYAEPGASQQAKGHEWKVGYHVTMMLTELMRLDGVRFRSGAEVLL
jgi:mannose/cellobiose epimerase-like protein (N-acyl-D-glucosamine 2-epimerase family)